jgi:hypothetical protein
VEPSREEVHALASALDLSTLGVASTLRNNQRSKLDHFGDHLYLALQPAQYDDAAEAVECHEVDVFVGDELFVAISPDGAVDLEQMRALLEEHPEVLQKGSYGVLWATLEYVTRGYRGVLDGVEHDIDQIEEELFGEDAGVSHRIFALQREVIDLHHATAPLENMLDRLQRIVSARAHVTRRPPSARSPIAHATWTDVWRRSAHARQCAHGARDDRRPAPQRRDAAHDGAEHSAERPGEEDLVLGGDRLRSHARRRHLRNELPVHARAVLAVGLSVRDRPDDRGERGPALFKRNDWL